MKIVIFGGTTEGRELSARLREAGAEVTVCVASAYGKEEQERVPGVIIRTGPLNAQEKQKLLREAALCVDATHPYARHVTASVKEACHEAGIRYLRLAREAGSAGNALFFQTAEEAAEWLSHRSGNILLTTGAKELPAFSVLERGRLFARVLPSHASLSACEACDIPHRNILAMQGPFSRELNAALIRQYQIRFLVTKDGGLPGGLNEKAEAAEETGAQLLVLRRPKESGLSFDEVLKQCKTLLSGPLSAPDNDVNPCE